MTNLEELVLNLAILRENARYVNGTQLNDEIIRYMSHLKKFTFSLETALLRESGNIVLPSNEDMDKLVRMSKFFQLNWLWPMSYLRMTISIFSLYQ